jgi:hypothetical protein
MTDALIIGGGILIGVGVGLLDWRLAIVWAGVLALAIGLARMRMRP